MRTLASLIVFLALASPARADVIVSVPLGTPGAPGVGGATDQYLYMSWTQPIGYTDVAITAHIWSNSLAFTQGTAWITQHVGPGTAPGSELTSATVTYPSYQTPVPGTLLFSGLTLGAGTWYLILSAAHSDDAHLAWENGGAPVLGPGITVGPTGLTAGPWADLAYPAASMWGSYPVPLAFTVRGTPAQVAEPATALLLGTGLLAVGRMLRRRP